MFCECGERVTKEFLEVNDRICQLKWYSLSIKMQRMLPNILLATQEPVVVQGFGNCSCTREAFKNVSLSIIQISID